MQGIREVIEGLDEVRGEVLEGAEGLEGAGGGAGHVVGQGDEHGEQLVNGVRVGRGDEGREERER